MFRALYFGILLFAVAGHAQPQQTLNILFLGKTQTGKSSLINIFYNHIVGKKHEDERAIVIPLRDGADDLFVNVDPYQNYGVGLRQLGGSQTTQVLRYTASNDRYTVHLWDAPGFNDTNEEVTDEETVRRIATAIGETSFNAVAVVLKPNEPATFDIRANMDRVRTMLPKAAEKNIIGIYTRATNASKGVRKAGAEAFANLLRIHSVVRPQTYFMDGSSFFDDGAFDGPARWGKDSSVVHQLLNDVANLEPFDAKEVSTIQNIADVMRAKAENRNNVVTGINEAVAESQRLYRDFMVARHIGDENREYAKQRRVRVETGQAVYYQNKWITDENQKARYYGARQRSNELYDQFVALERHKEALQATEGSLLRELRELKSEWKSRVLWSNTHSFIDYLDHQIRFAQRQSSCSDASRESRIALLESQKNFYELIRDL